MTDSPVWSGIYGALDPPPRMSVSEWAAAHRRVSRQWSRHPGPWRNERTPHLVGVMDAFSSPHVRKITICKAAQAGGTEALMNMLGFAIWGDPGPAMWVYPAHTDARRLLERIKGLSDASPTISEARSKDRYDQTLVGCRWRDMWLWFASSKTPRALAQLPCRYVFCDETDKYDRWTGEESDPVSLAEQRVQTFTGIEKVVLDSTPTTEDGYIWTSLQTCHQLRFYVPCEVCGTHQEMTWAQVEWPADDRAEEAVYRCIECSDGWDDAARRGSIGRGIWAPEGLEPSSGIEPDPLEEEHVGFHWSRLYSKIHDLGALARLFVASRNYPEKMQSFTNNVLALPWVEVVEAPDRGSIRTMGADDYRRGEIPGEVQVITVGVDVHKTYFRWVMRGWGHLATSWLIDYGWIMYEPERFDWPEVERRFFPHRVRLDGQMIPIDLILVDSGYKEDEVYGFARPHPERVRATKGNDQISQPYLSRYQDNVGIMLWSIRPSYYKGAIFGKLLKGAQEDGAMHFPIDTGDDYWAELCSQRKERVTNRRTGRISYQWALKRGQRDDHYLDCEVLCFAGGDMRAVMSLPTPDEIGRSTRIDASRLDRELAESDAERDWIVDGGGDWLDW